MVSNFSITTSIIHTFGSTVHCDLLLVVSKLWEAAAATEAENPAVRLTVKGDNGPTSSFNLGQDKHA